MIKNLSKYYEWKNKAERFCQMIQTARSLSTAKAIQFIYDSMYRRYATKNDMDSKKLDILIALASSEPDIGSFLKRMEALPTLIDMNSHRSKQAVVLSTVHSGKGKEFDTVYIMDAFNGYLPECDLTQLENNNNKADEYQEERRVFYVAMTRAKNKLFVFDIDSCASSFVRELPTVPYKLHQDVDSTYNHSHPPIRSTNTPSHSIDIQTILGYAPNNRSIVNRTVNMEQPHSQEESIPPTQYEIGYDEVKNLFVQQTSIIRDHFNHRWVKCEKCGGIKQESEFITYGGSNHLNLGICKSCGMRDIR